jgi:hypothetical protein
MFLGGDNNLAMVSNIDAVLQDCEHTMKALFQEMIYAYDRGLPYFQTVWQKKNFVQFEAQGRSALLRVNGVVSVLLFVVTTEGDVLSYNAVIETIYGVGSFNG